MESHAERPEHSARPAGAAGREEKARSFIAVWLPGEVRAALANTAADLGRGMRFVKWVEEENIHLTLAFLGDVERVRLADVARALREVGAGAQPFMMRVEGIGAFPNRRRPRVVWAGVTAGAPELVSLAEGVTEALGRLHFPREDRRFSPHVTIGRLRQGDLAPPLLIQRLEAATFQSSPFAVEEIRLMKSELTRSGPIYDALDRARLGGPPQGGQQDGAPAG